MYILKTNTAARIAVGPLVDPTDGKTAETSLTVTDLSVQLYQIKTDGNAVVRTQFTPTASGGDNDMALVASSTDGMYDLELTATQLNFLGNARISFYDLDGFLVHWIDIQVVSAAYFNWLFGTTIPEVNVTQINGDADIDEILAGYVWDASTSDHGLGGTYGAALEDVLQDTSTTLPATLSTIDGIVDAVLEDTNELQTDLADGGRLDLLIDSIIEDTDVSIPAALAEINTDLPTTAILAALTTIDNNVDAVLEDTGTTLPALLSALSTSISGVASAVWNYLTSAMTTAGSIGYKLAVWLGASAGTIPAFGISDLAVCNNALMLFGHDPLEDLDGTDKATKLVTQFYEQAVNATLRAYPWNCALKRSDSLTADSSSPNFEWDYAYTLPDDCLRVIRMQNKSYDYRVEGDLLLTNESEAYVLYIARIDVDDMDQLLIDAISARLAHLIAFPLTNSNKTAEDMFKKYLAILDEAQAVDAQEGGSPEQTEVDSFSDWNLKRL